MATAPSGDAHEVTKKVKSIKLGSDLSFAKKQDAGVEGESKFAVMVNMWSVYPSKEVPFYRYEFCVIEEYPEEGKGRPRIAEVTKRSRNDYTVIERKNKCVAVFTLLLKKEKKFFGCPESFVYDRAAILYSLDKLEIKNGEAKFSIPCEELPDYLFPEECVKVTVTIKPCDEDFVINAKDYKSCLNPSAKTNNKALEQFYELLLSQEAFFTEGRFVSYGTGESYLLQPEDFGFNEKDVPELPDGKYLGVGASKRVKFIEGARGKPTLSVCLDVKKAAFHVDNQNLAEKAALICRSRAIGDRIEERQIKILNKILKGLYVRCCYGKFRTFTINCLLAETAEKMRVEVEGKLVTIVDYYKKKYNMVLKYKSLPLIVEKTPKGMNYYPMELLEVCENQRVILTQQSSNQVQMMIRACAIPPFERLRQIRNVTRAMKLDKEGSENRWLKELDVKIARENIQVGARMLQKPTVVYGNGEVMNVKETASWTVKSNARFLIPRGCEVWCAYALISSVDQFQRRNFDYYLSHFLTRCRQRGMLLRDPVEATFIHRAKETDVDECFATARQKNATFIHFVTSESLKYHEKIKYLESQYQILTQDLLSRTASAAPNKTLTLDNIVNKTNLKLGGLNFGLRPTSHLAQKWFNGGDRLIIAYDMSFTSMSRIDKGVKSPSVVGYSSNCQRHPLNFIGGYRYAWTVREKLFEEETVIRDLVIESLRLVKKTRGIPRHIVIFRDGVSEGEYRYVLEKEVEEVKKGCSEVGGNSYVPLITFILVTKMHSLRLFRKVINRDSRAMAQNIPAGTVIDKEVVDSQLTEFYLNSHVALQGTARTPRYNVLYDTADMSSDEIQGLSFALCFNLQIVGQACSLPAPLIIANEMAARGRSNFGVLCGCSSDESEGYNLEHLNKELGYEGKALSQCRFNA